MVPDPTDAINRELVEGWKAILQGIGLTIMGIVLLAVVLALAFGALFGLVRFVQWALI